VCPLGWRKLRILEVIHVAGPVQNPAILTKGYGYPIYKTIATDRERIEAMDDDRNHDSQELDEKIPDEEKPIDLNMLFSEEKKDLNRLFADPRVRRFLRDVQRNQRDVERFLKRLEIDSEVPERSGGGHEVS
jgi:hypothetical protein